MKKRMSLLLGSGLIFILCILAIVSWLPFIDVMDLFRDKKPFHFKGILVDSWGHPLKETRIELSVFEDWDRHCVDCIGSMVILASGVTDPDGKFEIIVPFKSVRKHINGYLFVGPGDLSPGMIRLKDQYGKVAVIRKKHLSSKE
jgi:hypothetical protein